MLTLLILLCDPDAVLEDARFKRDLKKEIFDYLVPISFLMSEVHFTR